MADGAAPLAADAVTAILRHMNGDHAADCLVIVQGLGGRPDATAATMAGVTADAAVFDVVVPDGTVEVRVPWSEPIVERGQVRTEVVRMYQEGCAALGVTAPAAGEH
jgi:hypothetical protein